MSPATPKHILRNFYDQALMTPELLCLNCAHMVWRGPKRNCSPARKEDCLFFVNDMLNWLVSGHEIKSNPKQAAIFFD